MRAAAERARRHEETRRERAEIDRKAAEMLRLAAEELRAAAEAARAATAEQLEVIKEMRAAIADFDRGRTGDAIRSEASKQRK